MGRCGIYTRKRGGKPKKAKKSTVKKPVKAKGTIKKKKSSDSPKPSQTDQAPINQRWMTDNVGASKRTKKSKKSKGKKSKGKKRPITAWQKHLMKVFHEMKSKDKSVKFGDAMREAKKSYN
tara:strand:- start:3761 stop:4123 length:363 start_codon:yes stop_codon:yes gene_type:complete